MIATKDHEESACCYREDWIDRWRGLLMLCIVAFHVVGAIVPKCSDSAVDVASFLQSQFATFHTRGFFVLSGMLFHSGMSWRIFLARKFKRLLVPYFIFGFAWAVVFAIGGVYYPHMTVSNDGISTLAAWKPFVSVLLADGWPDGIGFRVINALWFLPCLFLVEIIYFWVDKAVPNKYWQLCFLPVCYALNNMLFKPDIFWGMNLVPRFMACFIIGRVLFDRKKVRMNALLMLLIAVLLLYLVISPRVVGYIAAAVGFEQWKDLLRGLCGLVACAAVAQAVPLKALSVAGRSTMGILVTHKAFVMAVQLVPFHVHSRILAVILVMGETAFALTGALVLTVSLRRICPWIIGESK